MENTSQLQIMDVTIRDGSYRIDFAYTPEQVGEIVAGLAGAGLPYIEASHGVGVGAHRVGYPQGASDLAYAKAAAAAKKRAKVGAIGDPKITTAEDITQLAEHLDFFRLIALPDDPDAVKGLLEQCKKEGLETFIQLTRSYAVSPQVLAASVQRLSGWGADCVYLVDTTGCMLPGEVTRAIEAIRKVSDLPLGFHAHNTLQLALANTIEAIQAGVAWADASLLGVGRDAGNVFLEALVIVLEQLKIPTGIDLKKLILAGEYVRPLFPDHSPPPWATYYLASYRRDLYPLKLIDILAQECNKSPFEVIDAFAALPDIILYDIDDLEVLIRKLGGDPAAIFEKYQIQKSS